MKRTLLLIVAALVCLAVLVACGHEHEWSEATCTEPSTCSGCGKTQGDPLGHTWLDATCTEPATCSVCGATDGEPLGHDFAPANYQSPATCIRCDETEGEPLTPELTAYDLSANMELNVPYTYAANCASGNAETVGQVTVTDYQIVESDDTHPAKSGYEWRMAELSLSFTDENALALGVDWQTVRTDYYTFSREETSGAVSLNGVELARRLTVNYQGVDMDAYYHLEVLDSGWTEDAVTLDLRACFQVPVGYDGCVIGVTGVGPGEGQEPSADDSTSTDIAPLDDESGTDTAAAEPDDAVEPETVDLTEAADEPETAEEADTEETAEETPAPEETEDTEEPEDAEETTEPEAAEDPEAADETEDAENADEAEESDETEETEETEDSEETQVPENANLPAWYQASYILLFRLA